MLDESCFFYNTHINKAIFTKKKENCKHLSLLSHILSKKKLIGNIY